MLNKNSSEFRDWLKGRLNDGSEDVLVTFTKKDGSERVMRCTLAESRIPPASKEDPASQKKVRTVSDEVCVVYDVEKSGWRSFRWESLTGVDVEAAS